MISPMPTMMRKPKNGITTGGRSSGAKAVSYTHLDVYKRQVFHGLLCGSPEDLRPLEAVTAARVFSFVSKQVPGVLDVSCRPNVMISVIKIKKAYEGHGRHAILCLLYTSRCV